MRSPMLCPVCHKPMATKDVSKTWNAHSTEAAFSAEGARVMVHYLNVFRHTCPQCGRSWIQHGESIRPE